MEYLYSIDTKPVGDKTYYFVKKLMTFPEFQGLANVQIGYGMHTSFEKACHISGVHDSASRNLLLAELAKRNISILPVSQATMYTVRPQKTRVKYTVQIAGIVNHWLAERRATFINWGW